MEDPTAAAYVKNIMELAQRVAVLESRADRYEALLATYADRFGNLQLSIDSIKERMAFVDRLETMDTSLTMLVKFAKGAVYAVGTGAALVAAFKVGDIEGMRAILEALLQ